MSQQDFCLQSLGGQQLSCGGLHWWQQQPRWWWCLCCGGQKISKRIAMFLSGEGAPSPVGEAEVTVGSQLKNDLCVSCHSTE